MLKEINLKSDIFLLKVVLTVFPFVYGGFHIWVSALLTVVLLAFLYKKYAHNSQQKSFSVNISLLTVMLIPVFYLITVLWAVDRGTAVYGFFKYLPVTLFALAVFDMKNEEKNELLDSVPYSAVIMGVVSYALSFIPSLSDDFLVVSRLGGFFQYPNSFAIFCIAGIAILLLKNDIGIKHWLMSALLVAIVLLTGSRTAFVFLIVAAAFLVFRLKRKSRLILVSIISVALIISILVVVLTGNMQTVGRFLTISSASSSLLGRILYYIDALPVILKNPLGMGYYGYYFSQGSFQTGIYSVTYIHNDFLQFFLDIGWFPGLMFIFVSALSIFSRKTTILQKAVLFIILGHSLFDFNLQFICIFMILMLTFDFESLMLFDFNVQEKLLKISSVILAALSLFFGTVNLLYLTDNNYALEKIYPFDTQNQMKIIAQSDNYNEMNYYADKILKMNKYISLAYSVKANVAFQEGEILQMIEYKEKAIKTAPYVIEEYEDLCEKLIYVIDLYEKAGDVESADFCREKLLNVLTLIQMAENKTSAISWKLKYPPDFDLEDKYDRYIESIK